MFNKRFSLRPCLLFIEITSNLNNSRDGSCQSIDSMDLRKPVWALCRNSVFITKRERDSQSTGQGVLGLWTAQIRGTNPFPCQQARLACGVGCRELRVQGHRDEVWLWSFARCCSEPFSRAAYLLLAPLLILAWASQIHLTREQTRRQICCPRIPFCFVCHRAGSTLTMSETALLRLQARQSSRAHILHVVVRRTVGFRMLECSRCLH